MSDDLDDDECMKQQITHYTAYKYVNEVLLSALIEAFSFLYAVHSHEKPTIVIYRMIQFQFVQQIILRQRPFRLVRRVQSLRHLARRSLHGLMPTPIQGRLMEQLQ